LLGEQGWFPLRGKEVAPGSGERESWTDLVLPDRLLDGLQRLNPQVPVPHLREAAADILRITSTDAITENHRCHRFLTQGYRGISWIDHDGIEHNPTIRIISADESDNDWVAVNQVTVRSREVERRFDLVLYCNGLPVSIIELKRAGSASADVAAAHAQLQTYVRELPHAFRFAVFTVASDGVLAKYGTPFTPLNHFSPWNVDDDGKPTGDAEPGLDQLINGVYHPMRFLQLLRDFTAFDADDGGYAKRIAKPHQYF